MRISDWSSDVCSSDLLRHDAIVAREVEARVRIARDADEARHQRIAERTGDIDRRFLAVERAIADRKSVVSGKSVSVRVDLGGRRIIKKKKQNKRTRTQQAKIMNMTNTNTTQKN